MINVALYISILIRVMQVNLLLGTTWLSILLYLFYNVHNDNTITVLRCNSGWAGKCGVNMYSYGDARIVGGETVRKYEFPWMVSAENTKPSVSFRSYCYYGIIGLNPLPAKGILRFYYGNLFTGGCAQEVRTRRWALLPFMWWHSHTPSLDTDRSPLHHKVRCLVTLALYAGVCV